ncbi:MAG: HD domain-containing protein [Clostridiales bacterium]|nr:HD domain-containing protein [Clostridiales bacterium]
MCEVLVPERVLKIIKRLSGSGFEAYAVGGCVRDSLMGKTPNDWDITTSALPQQIKAALPEYKSIDVGIQHGTVCIISEGEKVEVTSFRTDGKYTDNRHPESVSFTSSLHEDLSRRDFTINAMAYNDKDGIVDIFGGAADIRKHIIRCVGEPERRFNEDALRILRGMRFASVLGFEIEEDTAKAIHSNKSLLENISAERINAELDKLLCGGAAKRILLEYSDVFQVFIPEITECIGFHQYGKKHAYDVWEHICHTVGEVEGDRILRLTMLLHDLGKPETHALNEAGESTFENHAAVGSRIAHEILHRLKYDKRTIMSVSRLIKYHDFKIPESKPEAKRLLMKVSPEEYLQLLEIKRADRAALSESFRDVSEKLVVARALLTQILENGECFTLDALAVNGNDLKRAGIEPAQRAEYLNILLGMVADGEVDNSPAALGSAIARLKDNKV